MGNRWGQRFQVASFFGLAYLLAWLAWVPTVLKARGLINWELPGAGTWGLFGSSIAAFLVVGLTEGRPAMKHLTTFMTRIRMRWTWLLAAVVGPVALSFIAWLVGLASGSAPTAGKDLPLTVTPLYFLVQVVTMLLTEEPGWRGFALPRLQERYGAPGGSLILGLLWACWHLPLFLIPGRPQAAMPFAGFVLSVTAATVLMTWVQNNAGSGFAAVLFHAAMNTGFATLGTLTSGPRLFWICAAVWAVVAGGVYAATGLRQRHAPQRSAA